MKNNNSSTFLPPPPPAYPGSQGQCFAADPQFGCDAQHKAKQEEHQRYYQRTLNFQQRQMSSAKSATTVRYRFNPYSSDSAIVPAQSEPSGICGLHCEPHTHTPFVPQDVRLGSDHNSQLPPPHYDGAAASVYQQQLPYSHQHQHHQMDPYEHYNFQEEHHHQQQLHHLHHLQESRQERYHYHQVHPYLPQYDHEYHQEEEPQQYYQHHHPHHEQYQLQHLQHLQERRQQRYHYHQVHQYDHQYPPELPPPYHQQQQQLFQHQQPLQHQQQWSPQPPAPPAVAVIDSSVLGSIVGAGWPVIRPCDAVISPPTAANQQQDNTISGDTEGGATTDNRTSGANDDNVSGGGPIAAGPNIGSGGGGGGRGDVVVPPSEEGARVGIPLPPSTIHRSLYGRATLVPYPQKEFHAPAENEPPEVTDAAFAAGAVVRVFIGQLPYYVTDMQLNWICHTFGAGCLVHYCERITKRHVHTGEVGPTGCVHAVCPAESAAALCAHLTKKLLIDDSGVWIATNHSEAQALSEHVLRLKTDRSMRVPQRPYDTVVFQLAKSVGPMRGPSDSGRRACGGLDAELPPTYQQSRTAAAAEAAATEETGNSRNNGPLPPYRLAVSDLLCDEEEGHAQRRCDIAEEGNDEEARSGGDSPLSNNTACPSDKQQIQSAGGNNNKSSKKSNKKHRRTNTAPPPPATVLPRGRTPATQPSSPQNANVPLTKALGGPITPTTSLPPKALSALIAQQQQQQHNAKKSNSATEAHTTPVSGASVPSSFPPHLSMAGRCFAPSSGPSCEPQYSHDDSSALPSTAYIIRSGPTVSPTGAVNGLFPTVQ